MKKHLIYFLFIFTSFNVFGQNNGEFTDLDRALQNPELVEVLMLGPSSKYSNAKEFPKKLSECKNLHKIRIIGNHKINFPKLLKQLSKLPKLDTLIISASWHVNEIPESIGNLKNLKYLDLSHNGIKKINNKILTLQNLIYLNLSDNQLKNLPENFYKLQSLKNLNLTTNPLENLPQKFELIKLESLDLGSEGYIYYDFQEKFPHEIFQINTLKHLGLYSLKIDSFDIKIKNLSNLNSLTLKSLINFDWSKSIVNLSTLSQLKILELGFNRIDAPKEISQLKNIEELSISYCRNSYETMESICELKKLKKIYFLNYYDKKIPKKITNLINLKSLILVNSFIDSLPFEIGNLINLGEIEIPKSYKKELFIPNSFWNLNLLKLNLQNCKIYELPKEIENLKNLTDLNLSNNNIKNLPNEFYKLNNIKKLDLSYNDLQEIDTNIFKLINLKILDLSDNISIKTIPESIGNLPSIFSIDLTNTNINSLPKSLIKHPSLNQITLCEFLFEKRKSLDSLYERKIYWFDFCRNLEKEHVNFEKNIVMKQHFLQMKMTL